MQNPSNRMGCCDKCCHSLNKFGLLVQNTVDFLVGIVLISFSVYIYHNIGSNNFNNLRVAWLGYCCIVLGILLVAISSLGFLSIIIDSCRCLTYAANFFSRFLSLLCLSLGIAFAILRENMLEYFDENVTELGLTNGNVEFIKNWYTVCNVSLFILSVLQIVRIQANARYRETSYRIEKEFSALLDQEESVYEEKHKQRKDEIREKYENLKKTYSDKFNSGKAENEL